MKPTDLSNIMCMAWRFYRTTRQAFGECLKLAWRNFNLVRNMHTEVVRFYFRKVDGTLRFERLGKDRKQASVYAAE